LKKLPPVLGGSFLKMPDHKRWGGEKEKNGTGPEMKKA
jgi:hypothetical protein